MTTDHFRAFPRSKCTLYVYAGAKRQWPALSGEKMMMPSRTRGLYGPVWYIAD